MEEDVRNFAATAQSTISKIAAEKRNYTSLHCHAFTAIDV